jgi:hypothetical protein
MRIGCPQRPGSTPLVLNNYEKGEMRIPTVSADNQVQSGRNCPESALLAWESSRLEPSRLCDLTALKKDD